RVILMCARIAEIGEYSVADEPGDNAVVGGNDARAGGPIGAEHLPHVLGIEARRERSRADQIAEHDREMASLGIVLRGRLGNQSCLIELDDCTLHFATMAEKDIEPIEVLVLQIGQDVNIDPILDKTLRVLPKPKLFEPVRNLLHACVPATGSLRPAEFWTTERNVMLICQSIACVGLRHSAAALAQSFPKWCKNTADCYYSAHSVVITT